MNKEYLGGGVKLKKGTNRHYYGSATKYKGQTGPF